MTALGQIRKRLELAGLSGTMRDFRIPVIRAGCPSSSPRILCADSEETQVERSIRS
jgi:hypothetical protein